MTARSRETKQRTATQTHAGGGTSSLATRDVMPRQKDRGVRAISARVAGRVGAARVKVVANPGGGGFVGGAEGLIAAVEKIVVSGGKVVLRVG